MSKLSIIIPTFNSADTIQRCLRSIGIQTFADYEIVVQDGGSSDRTVELIQEFWQENPGIRVELERKPDKGIYDAMNKGSRRANGKWLYFLGCDDELHNQDVLNRMLCSSDADDYDVLYGNVHVIGNASWASDGAIYNGPFDLRELLSKNICHQAIFYKTAFFRKVGSYNQKYVICADWDFNMRCWAEGRFHYLDVIVAKVSAGGVSGQGRSDPHFEAEKMKNVIRYFNLSSRDPLITSSSCDKRANDARRFSRISPSRVLRALARRMRITR